MSLYIKLYCYAIQVENLIVQGNHKYLKFLEFLGITNVQRL